MGLTKVVDSVWVDLSGWEAWHDVENELLADINTGGVTRRLCGLEAQT